MMKKRNILVYIGMIIYLLLSFIDFVIYKIPDLIYILIASIALTLIIIGFIKDRKIKNKKEIIDTKNKIRK